MGDFYSYDHELNTRFLLGLNQFKLCSRTLLPCYVGRFIVMIYHVKKYPNKLRTLLAIRWFI